MSRQEILAKIKTIVKENLERDVPEDANEETRTYDDLEIDSIMMLQLVVYLEEEFDITVPDEEVNPAYYETLGSLINFVELLLGSKV